MSLSDAERKRVFKARALWEQDKVDEAWEIMQKLLAEHPFERDCLYMAGHIYEKANNMPVAYHMFKLATEQDPREASGWLNFGRLAEELWRTKEAERAYEKALKLCKRDDTMRCTLGNLAALCIDNGRYAEAEKWASKALADWPDFHGARANLGFAQLGQGNFAEGWKSYRHNIGTPARTKIQYKDEPEWDGTPGKTVAIYGEQGIGDEICFASMIPDAIRDCKQVIMDCDVRLSHLFQRSFPDAVVYGTRQARPNSGALWRKEHREIDASIPSGQIGEYYRTSKEGFPRRPYLKPDPNRLFMWRALFRSKVRPVIGIAWSGGIPKTGEKFRRCTPEDWAPLFKSIDAHFVSLQYKSAALEIDKFRANGVDLVEYPFATITNDYDDTAAMVAAMDCIVGVPTSVIHLGGALGVPTFAMHSKMDCWKYAQGNLFQPVTNVRWAGSWKDTIASTIEGIKEVCSGSSSDTIPDSRLPITSCNPRLSGIAASP